MNNPARGNTRQKSKRTHKKKAGNAYGLAHDDLVQLASKWLQRFCVIVITEMTTSGREECDAIGFNSRANTALIECKATRSDFFSDAKKRFRKHPEQGMGNLRLYMTPKGLVDVSEVPKGWGLIECTRKQIHRVHYAQEFREKNSMGERILLVSALRRIGQYATQGVSVRPYVFNTRNRATLGVLDDIN